MVDLPSYMLGASTEKDNVQFECDQDEISFSHIKSFQTAHLSNGQRKSDLLRVCEVREHWSWFSQRNRNGGQCALSGDWHTCTKYHIIVGDFSIYHEVHLSPGR